MRQLASQSLNHHLSSGRMRNKLLWVNRSLRSNKCDHKSAHSLFPRAVQPISKTKLKEENGKINTPARLIHTALGQFSIWNNILIHEMFVNVYILIRFEPLRRILSHFFHEWRERWLSYFRKNFMSCSAEREIRNCLCPTQPKRHFYKHGVKQTQWSILTYTAIQH